MSTFINDLNNNIEERWEDVNRLLVTAKSVENTDKPLHDVLCRSAIMFISAHLESFVKDVAKAIINDLNNFSSFKSAPESMKKVYCKTYTNSNAEIPSNNKGEINKDAVQRTQMLLETLDSFDVKFVIEPFLINNSFGNNQKNPSPNLISKIFINFGIKQPFKWLDNSIFNTIFEGTSASSKSITDNALMMKNHINDNTTSYPYKLDIKIANIQEPSSVASSAKLRSFWETFLDELMAKRHRIAHGSSFAESLSVEALNDYKSAVTILERLLIIVLCYKVTN